MIKQQAIQCLGLKQMKRDFYDPAAVINITEWQISVWPGYKTTIRQHEQELLMGCEVTHKMLRTDSALSTIRQIQNRFRGGPEAIRAIRRSLIGAIVISTYNNRTYRIDDISFDETPMCKNFLLN
jgi:aubergine-like protein